MDLTAFLLGAGATAGALRGLRALRDHKPLPKGLSDLLDWDSFADDNVVRLYSGGLIAFWAFEGRDLELASAAERRAAAEQIGQALKPLGAGWMFHVDVVRTHRPLQAEAAHFSSPVTALLERERIETFSGPECLLQTTCVLALTFAPDPDAGKSSAAARLLGSFGREQPASATASQVLLGRFREEAAYLEDRLASVLKLRAMTSEEVLRHLHFCLTGLAHRVRPPACNMALGDYLADQPLFGGLAPRVGQRHLRVVSPHELQGQDLTPITELPFPLRWSTRFIPLSTGDAKRRIRSKRHQWIKARKDLMATLKTMFGGDDDSAAKKKEEEEFFENRTARRYAGEAAEALAVIESGRGRYGLYSSSVILTGVDEAILDERVREVRSCFRTCGSPARVEELGAMGAYHGSLPGNGYANPRRFLLHTGNFGALFPAHRSFEGRAHNPSSFFPGESPPVLVAKGQDAGCYRLHLHARGDVGHTLLVGATGAGKSMLVNTLLAQWDRYEGAQSFLFDVGYSGLPLAQATGAAHYELNAQRAGDVEVAGEARQGLRPQPLRRLSSEEEQAWATSWLELYFELQGLPLGPGQRQRLQEAIRLVGGHLSPDERTLSVLREQIQDRDLRQALAPITGGGPYAHLFDGREASGAGHAARQVYELGRVRQLSASVFTPLLAYLFHRVERRLTVDRPSLIVLEEAWSALKEPAFAERMKEWLLTLRKKNASVVLVAHTVSQLEELGALRDVIIDSCQTKIYLPNPAAEKPGNARLYQSLGLNRREIRALAHATRKRDYFVKSGDQGAMIDLCLGPLALRALTFPKDLSVPRYRARVARLKATYGEQWFAEHLRTGGLERWAERYEDELVRGQDARPQQNAGPQHETGSQRPAEGEPSTQHASLPSGASA